MSVGDAHRVFVKAAGDRVQGCPVKAEGNSSSTAGCSSDTIFAAQQACPQAGTASEHSSRINMDVVPNAPAVGSSSGPALSVHREKSSIPMAADNVPKHQEGHTAEVWVYPSEQQFFNAMKRKGWAPSEDDMAKVVAIHNTVNERAWQHILAWEALHACDCATPRLKRFQGKPNEFSPKARILNFLGFKLPFDRHDWVVDRCGQDVRYIIDFYSGAPQPGVPASMHLDVRPALDSLGALVDRLRMQARWVASGQWQYE